MGPPATAPSPAAPSQPPAQPPAQQSAEPARVTVGWLRRLNPFRRYHKETPEYLVRKGNNLLQGRNYNQAIVAFDQAIALDERHAPAYLGLGKASMLKGGKTNFLVALQYFALTVQHDAMNATAYRAAAVVYEKLGKHIEAKLQRKKLAMVKALNVNPRNPVANNNMGILMLREDEKDSAIEYFKRAISAKPDYDIAYRNLALTFYGMAAKVEEDGAKGEYLRTALQAIGEALNITESASTLIASARLHLLSEEPEKALEELARAQTLDPSNKIVFAVRQLTLSRLGRMTEAQRAHEKYESLRSHEAADEAKLSPSKPS